MLSSQSRGHAMCGGALSVERAGTTNHSRSEHGGGEQACRVLLGARNIA